MKLRTKLLLPLMLVFLLGFSGFVAYQVSSQIAGRMGALAAEMEMDTELVATANNAYVWNLDGKGLEQSLATFLKKNPIVGVRILDTIGTVLAEAAEKEMPPNLTVKERNIVWEGQVIGKAEVTFTDHFVRKEVLEMGINSSVLGIVLFLLMATALGAVTEISVKPVRSLLAVTKDIAEGEGDLLAVVRVKSRDEIGALSGYFNAFLGKLRGIVLELKDRGTERISGTFTSISNIAEENRLGIDEMKVAMENITKAVTFVSNLAKENAANIEGLDRTLSHFKT